MPRGVHPASRANLAQTPGGDRYAGKRLVIQAIEDALAAIENGREIREFFGLSAGRLLTQKHRARWAEVKAPAIYDAMVEGMTEGALSYAGLRIGGFISRARLTGGRGRLFPVGQGVGPLAADEIQQRRVEMVLLPGNYDGAPFEGETAAHSLAISPVDSGVEGWFYVPVQSAAQFQITFGDGTAQQFNISTAPAGVLVWGYALPSVGGAVPKVFVTEPERDWESGGGGFVQEPQGWFLTPAEWRRRRRPVMVDWQAWEAIGPEGFPLLSIAGMVAAPVENWAENFPQVRAVVDSIRAGAVARGSLEWLTAAEWLQRYGAARASYLSAGCLCPPLVAAPFKRRVAITFDSEFIAAINEDPPVGAPEGAP